jgi:ABC-type protease/lipase transport system fused ATPase/permease subunit
VIIAGAILLPALGPVDLTIAKWRVSSRRGELETISYWVFLPLRDAPMQLPAPAAVCPACQCRASWRAPARRDRCILYSVRPGLGIIGPSGAANVAGAIVAEAGRGRVQIGGRPRSVGPRLGRHIGYLPRLRDFRRNRSRKHRADRARPGTIVRAARAGVHNLVAAATRIRYANWRTGAALATAPAHRAAPPFDPFLVVWMSQGQSGRGRTNSSRRSGESVLAVAS